MTEETVIDYSYVLLEEYKDLEDGRPNFRYNPALKVSGSGTILKFLELLSYNSNIDGITIEKINFKIQNELTEVKNETYET